MIVVLLESNLHLIASLLVLLSNLSVVSEES